MYKGVNQTLEVFKRQSEVRSQTTVRGLFVGWIRLMYKSVRESNEVTQTTVRGDSNDSPR